jgi:hypothetical protein
MSFSDPLVCNGISGRSSTINNSGLLALSRMSRRSRVTKPVMRVKMRSNLACNAVFRRLVGWQRQALRSTAHRDIEQQCVSLRSARQKFYTCER